MNEETMLIDKLVDAALKARNNARPRRSGFRVGAAVIDTRGNVYSGANVEVNWQHSYHAEENAIIAAAQQACSRLVGICVASDRDVFTPCGRCMDLIMEYGEKSCKIYCVNADKITVSTIRPDVTTFAAGDLMPHYPGKA
jgi:cytidine deaminase